MRALFVCRLPAIDIDLPTSDLALGGIEACNLELARALAKRGHRVSLAGTGRAQARTDPFGVTHLGLAEAATGQVDTIVVSNIATDFDALRRPGASPVDWMHNPLRLEKAVRKGYFGPLYRHRPRAVFPSEDLAERTFRYPFAAREVIGHGLDPAFLGAVAAKHDPTEPARFVFASQPHRGLDRVLRLWRELVSPALPRAELHLLGAAPAALADPAARIHVRGRLTKREMIDVYAGARAMLYPGAEDETFCLAALEAQCVGLPIVTMGIGALKERVSQGTDGFICHDDVDFADKAILLGRRGDLAAELGAGARQRRANRSWDFVAGLWEALVLAPRGRIEGAPLDEPLPRSA